MMPLSGFVAIPMFRTGWGSGSLSREQEGGISVMALDESRCTAARVLSKNNLNKETGFRRVSLFVLTRSNESKIVQVIIACLLAATLHPSQLFIR